MIKRCPAATSSLLASIASASIRSPPSVATRRAQYGSTALAIASTSVLAEAGLPNRGWARHRRGCRSATSAGCFVRPARAAQRRWWCISLPTLRARASVTRLACAAIMPRARRRGDLIRTDRGQVSGHPLDVAGGECQDTGTDLGPAADGADHPEPLQAGERGAHLRRPAPNVAARSSIDHTRPVPIVKHRNKRCKLNVEVSPSKGAR